MAHDIQEAGGVRAAMERGEEGHAQAGKQRQMQPVDMAMDDVELLGARRHGFEQDRLHTDRIGTRSAEAKA